MYRVKTATPAEIYAHLQECDRGFIPPLSSRVDLVGYSAKMAERAVTFEAWDNQILVGMIGAYFNDMDSRAAYITHLAIAPDHMGMGIAKALLEMCVRYAAERQFSRIKLEVARNNGHALKLYGQQGFRVCEDKGDSLLMGCDVVFPCP